MEAVGKPVESHWQCTKFVDGLKLAVKKEVNRTFTRKSSLTLEELYIEAEMEETALKPTFSQTSQPKLKGFQQRSKGTFCYFCESRAHTAATCPKIAAKKAAGTWEERPPRGGARQ